MNKEKQDYTQVQARLLAKHLIESENRRKEKQIEEIETIIKSNLAEGSFANAFAKKVAIQIVEYYQSKFSDSVETVQSNRCKTKCELTKKELKQFAERLKEQVYDSFGDKVIWYNDIDETLKEFIDE